MFKRKRHELKLESLATQAEFFEALENRHLSWARDTENPDITRVHFEIVDMVQEMRLKYNDLFDLYNKNES